MTNGISVEELTAAYTPFVNAGIYAKPYTFTKVMSHEGKTLLENGPKLSVAMSEQTAFIVHKLLENVVAVGTGAKAKLASGIPAAGKTGTTENDNDRWFVGYTPYYVGAVWFGYEKPKEIKGTTTNPALGAWKLVMDKVHANLAKKGFADAPSKIVQASYCIDSGGVPTDACRNDPRGNRIETGWFKVGTQPKLACTVHTPVEICTESNMLAGPYCPAETRKTVSLLNIKRELPEGIICDDWQYILPAFTVNPDGSITYEAPLAPEGKVGMNSVCNIHTHAPLPDPEYPLDPWTQDPWNGWGDPGYEDDPNLPDQPDNPANPTEPTSPTDPNNPNQPANPGGGFGPVGGE
jgi:penicillin-binding protein 1A